MFRRMGAVGQALLTVFVTVGGLGYAMAQESGESTVDVVKVDPVGEPSEDKARSPAEQRGAAESAVASASSSCSAGRGPCRAKRGGLPSPVPKAVTATTPPRTRSSTGARLGNRGPPAEESATGSVQSGACGRPTSSG